MHRARLPVLVLACGLAFACGEPGDDLRIEALGDGAVQLHPDDESDAPPTIEEGTPGAHGAGLIRIAGDCVYVQWCNEPGPSGTICRLRDGCSFSAATLNECIRDADTSCGTPMTPWYLF